MKALLARRAIAIGATAAAGTGCARRQRRRLAELTRDLQGSRPRRSPQGRRPAGSAERHFPQRHLTQPTGRVSAGRPARRRRVRLGLRRGWRCGFGLGLVLAGAASTMRSPARYKARAPEAGAEKGCEVFETYRMRWLSRSQALVIYLAKLTSPQLSEPDHVRPGQRRSVRRPPAGSTRSAPTAPTSRS